MKTRVKWVENVSFVGETGSGHAVVIDGAPESGGRNLGARPMELFLTGATACTAYDVVTILRKARQPISDCVVDAHAERAESPPRVFTRLHFKYTVAGRGLDRSASSTRSGSRTTPTARRRRCSPRRPPSPTRS